MDKFVLVKLIFFCCCWNFLSQQEVMAYESLIDYNFQNIESPNRTESITLWEDIRPSDMSRVVPNVHVSIHKSLSDMPHVSHFQ